MKYYIKIYFKDSKTTNYACLPTSLDSNRIITVDFSRATGFHDKLKTLKMAKTIELFYQQFGINVDVTLLEEQEL